jgi:hypothetical protein
MPGTSNHCLTAKEKLLEKEFVVKQAEQLATRLEDTITVRKEGASKLAQKVFPLFLF